MELKAGTVSEAKSWVKNRVFRSMPGSKAVDRSELMRMRWVAT